MGGDGNWPTGKRQGMHWRIWEQLLRKYYKAEAEGWKWLAGRLKMKGRALEHLP